MLRLEIADDGIGLKPAERASERRGIGLSNTESRLAELYGGRARILLREPPGGGVSVEIDLPLRLQEDTPSGSARQT
jgi:signal transduction histidine kinase